MSSNMKYFSTFYDSLLRKENPICHNNSVLKLKYLILFSNWYTDILEANLSEYTVLMKSFQWRVWWRDSVPSL